MNLRRLLMLFVVFFAGFGAPARAAEDGPGFAFPLGCTLGDTCWIMNYMDVDRAEGKIADYLCGARSYDQYNGTAFAVRNLRSRIEVLAAADGVVDVALDGKQGDKILNNPCGAGLVLKHAGGWETRYCSLAPGSVAVKAGEAVKRGQKIAMAGLSGKALWPQLHFDVMHRGRFFEPFGGRPAERGCGRPDAPLWQGNVPYSPLSVFTAGFSAGEVTLEQIRAGLPRLVEMPAQTPMLVMWAAVFGMQKGDRVQIAVYGPDGREFMGLTADVQDPANPQIVTAARARKEREQWSPGLYKGIVVVTRAADGRQLQDMRATSINLR